MSSILALVYEPKCGGNGGLRGLIQRVQLYTWSPINFRDLTSYLTYGFMSQVILTAGGLNDSKTSDSLVCILLYMLSNQGSWPRV
jgi:hypothetical protein